MCVSFIGLVNTMGDSCLPMGGWYLLYGENQGNVFWHSYGRTGAQGLTYSRRDLYKTLKIY